MGGVGGIIHLPPPLPPKKINTDFVTKIYKTFLPEENIISTIDTRAVAMRKLSHSRRHVRQVDSRESEFGFIQIVTIFVSHLVSGCLAHFVNHMPFQFPHKTCPLGLIF